MKPLKELIKEHLFTDDWYEKDEAIAYAKEMSRLFNEPWYVTVDRTTEEGKERHYVCAPDQLDADLEEGHEQVHYA